MTKIPVTEFTDDLRSVEENTQATDVFRLARSRKAALEQKSPSYSNIKWLTVGAFSAVFAFSLILPFGSDSLAPESMGTFSFCLQRKLLKRSFKLW